jgi:hypothetical protein
MGFKVSRNSRVLRVSVLLVLMDARSIVGVCGSGFTAGGMTSVESLSAGGAHKCQD